ncbi:MAG: CaiB/BaiF CoA-transferase family protein [Planctomycetota bacterium]
MSGTSISPLLGITVLDLTLNLPGPYCSRLLRDLGARVIKVEPPSGDPSRQSEALFHHLNYQKESICINLKMEAGKQILYRLLPKIDIFLESFRPEVCENMGLSYEQVRHFRKDIIYCRISGYGQNGPYKNYPAHDINLQSLSGFCRFEQESTLGRESAVPLADFVAGLFALNAITAALYYRQQSGEGDYLDIAMSDGLFHFTSLWHKTITPKAQIEEMATRFLKKWESRSILSRLGHLAWRKFQKTRGIRALYSKTFLQLLPHYGLFVTADQKTLCLGIVFEDHFWKNLCEQLGPAWSPFQNLRFFERIFQRKKLRKRLKKVFAQKTLQEWLKQLPPEKIPVNEAISVSEAYEHPQYRARNKIFRVHEELGVKSPLLREQLPETLSGEFLGAQSETLLKELQYSLESILQLREEKVIDSFGFDSIVKGS